MKPHFGPKEFLRIFTASKSFMECILHSKIYTSPVIISKVFCIWQLYLDYIHAYGSQTSGLKKENKYWQISHHSQHITFVSPRLVWRHFIFAISCHLSTARCAKCEMRIILGYICSLIKILYLVYIFRYSSWLPKWQRTDPTFLCMLWESK